MRRACWMLALCVMLAAGLTLLPAAGQVPPHEILVKSPTMKAGEMMPRDHTPDGRNQSPSLTCRWQSHWPSHQ